MQITVFIRPSLAAILQRVLSASVTVDKEVVSAIDIAEVPKRSSLLTLQMIDANVIQPKARHKPLSQWPDLYGGIVVLQAKTSVRYISMMCKSRSQEQQAQCSGTV